MDSIIQFDVVKGSIRDKKAIPIAHITNLHFVKDRNKANGYPVWLVSMYSGSHNHVNRFNDEDEAKLFYQDCLAKVEAYYQAMMPPKNDNAQDNADEISIAREYEKKANETVSRLANFIKMLFDQIQEDWQYKPNNIEEKMDCLKLWVRNKAKECK